MRPAKWRAAFVGVILALSVIACGSEPTPEDPTPTATSFLFTPTANLTLTAVFKPTDTATPLPVATATHTTTPGATSTETATPGPSPTPTPPDLFGFMLAPEQAAPDGVTLRDAPGVAALFVGEAPAIDGILGDWLGYQYVASNVVLGPEYYSQPADVMANFKIGWDMLNIYIGVDVKENRFVGSPSLAEMYNGDSVEITLDADLLGDYDAASLSSDDYRLGLWPGSSLTSGNAGAYLWMPISEAGPIADAQVAVSASGEGYLLEAAIPWSVFDVTPYPGSHLGFTFSLTDNDSVTQLAVQTIVSNLPQRVENDPTLWGELILVMP